MSRDTAVRRCDNPPCGTAFRHGDTVFVFRVPGGLTVVCCSVACLFAGERN